MLSRCHGNVEQFAPTSEDSAGDDRGAGLGRVKKAPLSLMGDVLTASLEAAEASCFRSEAAQIVKDTSGCRQTSHEN